MTVRELRRAAGNFVAINRGRMMGRSYVPHPRRAIFVETSGRCNLACRFCAYAKQPPGGFMKPELYSDVVGQIAELGFSHVWLTPMLGELFADPRVLERFAVLEDATAIRSYSFYTNFILPRATDIEELPQHGKLAGIFISIYGLDEDSFVLTTRKPARQFEKLLANLDTLFAATEAWRPPSGINFNIRTRKLDGAFLDRASALPQLLRKFRDHRDARVSVAQDYDSWGGTISRDEVAPLGLDIVDGRRVYMHGTCVKVFSEVQILADGRVHACACRDVDGSLMIGDMGERPLREILSLDNARYRSIIEAQMKGHFTTNCRSCSHYRSVYDDRAPRADPALEVVDYRIACRMLGGAS